MIERNIPLIRREMNETAYWQEVWIGAIIYPMIITRGPKRKPRTVFSTELTDTVL